MKNLLERARDLPQNDGEYGNRVRVVITRLEYFELTKPIQEEVELMKAEIATLERWRMRDLLRNS